mmetsp:Transcript_22954/g.43698  ORF Transcript_22954/g.43698 Transcript_22954/m.43698 type:complete len:290 (+) Transcript_22954:813-1682(+)
MVVAHTSHGGVEALRKGGPVGRRILSLEVVHQLANVQTEGVVQVVREVDGEVNHRLAHEVAVEAAHSLEELDQVRGLGSVHDGGHARVHEHQLRGDTRLLPRDALPHVAPEGLPHGLEVVGQLSHQDVARMQIRVHQVVHEHHLEHHRQAELCQNAVHQTALLLPTGVLCERHPFLERLYQHSRVRQNGLGEGDIVPLAKVVIERFELLALHREVHLGRQQGLELPRHLVEVHPAQRGDLVENAHNGLEHGEVVPDGVSHARMANLDRHARASRRRQLAHRGEARHSFL